MFRFFELSPNIAYFFALSFQLTKPKGKFLFLRDTSVYFTQIIPHCKQYLC